MHNSTRSTLLRYKLFDFFSSLLGLCELRKFVEKAGMDSE